jgi:hypothetical protein
MRAGPILIVGLAFVVSACGRAPGGAVPAPQATSYPALVARVPET